MEPLPVEPGEKERTEETIARLEAQALHGSRYAALWLPTWRRYLASVEASLAYWDQERADL